MNEIHIKIGDLDIVGTPEKVRKVMFDLTGNPFGTATHYLSESKGLLPIAGMNTIHLRNAVLKIYEMWVKGLHDIDNPKDIIAAIATGPQNPTWQAMVIEIAGRKE